MVQQLAATLHVLYSAGPILEQYCLNDRNITRCYIFEPPSGNEFLEQDKYAILKKTYEASVLIYVVGMTEILNL